MTPAQHTKFYFPNWLGTCRRLGWRMESGRLLSPCGNEHQHKVYAAACMIAAKEHRAPVIDDLRHGVHVVALGCDKSSKMLNNRELDRVVSYMQLMVDETNIKADMCLDNPDIKVREALVASIDKMIIPLSIIDDVCRKSYREIYASPHWKYLPIPVLRGLAGVLRDMKEQYLAESRS